MIFLIKVVYFWMLLYPCWREEVFGGMWSPGIALGLDSTYRSNGIVVQARGMQSRVTWVQRGGSVDRGRVWHRQSSWVAGGAVDVFQTPDESTLARQQGAAASS
jgi:hypothetical protein